MYTILAAQGQMAGAHDLIIARIAITHGYNLVTNKEDECKRFLGMVSE